MYDGQTRSTEFLGVQASFYGKRVEPGRDDESGRQARETIRLADHRRRPI